MLHPYLFLFSLTVLLLPISGVSLASEPSANSDKWRLFTDTAMTTRIELEFWHDEEHKADLIAKKVFERIHLVEQGMSRYQEGSELSRLNRQAGKEAVKVSPELFDVLQKALQISALSEGAFDISFGSVGYFYNYRRAMQPSEEDISNNLNAIDYRKISLNTKASEVTLLDGRMVLDLGGIAKGYAVDLGIQILQEEGVTNARLSAGGDMRLLGDKKGKPWIVGIRDPREEKATAVVLPLSDVAISTSGDYERFFIDEQGERIHHILSPLTGKPVKGIQSVTVIGHRALETDGLSTAVFVLGVEKGLSLINRLPGIDAIIVDERRVLHYSDDLVPPQ